MSTPPTTRPEVTPVMVIVIVYFGIWHLGLVFNSFGGAIDILGARICRAIYATLPYFVGATSLHALFLRHASKERAWDFRGPALAMGGVLLIILELCWYIQR